MICMEAMPTQRVISSWKRHDFLPTGYDGKEYDGIVGVLNFCPCCFVCFLSSLLCQARSGRNWSFNGLV